MLASLSLSIQHLSVLCVTQFSDKSTLLLGKHSGFVVSVLARQRALIASLCFFLDVQMCNTTLLQLWADLKRHSSPEIKPFHCEGSLVIDSFLSQITPSEWGLFSLDWLRLSPHQPTMDAHPHHYSCPNVYMYLSFD